MLDNLREYHPEGVFFSLKTAIVIAAAIAGFLDYGLAAMIIGCIQEITSRSILEND